NFDNWSIPESSLSSIYSSTCTPCEDTICEGYNTTCGGGGFFPFGFQGIVQGAGTAFYGFVGFDVIATLGEEVINPRRDIPLSIIVSLTVVFLSYFGISSIATLCLHHWPPWAVIIIQIGAFFGLFASLLGALIPLPRVIWAMASDGLLFKVLSRIQPRFKTPMIATVLSGTLAAIMAAVFNLKALVDLMSIGTLLGYTMVSICILILR
ncbi:Solute carrier family 7 (Cationic amino acid transporter_ y+ system)_ member 2, partial [Caligus rogercresseyi]